MRFSARANAGSLQRPQRSFYWRTMPLGQTTRQSPREDCASPVKLIHVLWSLGYMDPQGISLFSHEMAHFLRLENGIGQLPAQFPTVKFVSENYREKSEDRHLQRLRFQVSADASVHPFLPHQCSQPGFAAQSLQAPHHVVWGGGVHRPGVPGALLAESASSRCNETTYSSSSRTTKASHVMPQTNTS